MWTEYVTTDAGWRARVFVSIRAIQFEGTDIVRLVTEGERLRSEHTLTATEWEAHNGPQPDSRDRRVTADKRDQLGTKREYIKVLHDPAAAAGQ
jgi:dolichyl-phosphate-mannose--protein O-mannosyl transferase